MSIRMTSTLRRVATVGALVIATAANGPLSGNQSGAPSISFDQLLAAYRAGDRGVVATTLKGPAVFGPVRDALRRAADTSALKWDAVRAAFILEIAVALSAFSPEDVPHFLSAGRRAIGSRPEPAEPATATTFAAACSGVTPGLRCANVNNHGASLPVPPTRAIVVDAVNVVGKKTSAPVNRNRGGSTPTSVRTVPFSFSVMPRTAGSRPNRHSHSRSLIRNVGGALSAPSLSVSSPPRIGRTPSADSPCGSR